MASDGETWNPLCARTTVVLRGFLAGKADRTRDPLVRDHLAECESCMRSYQEAVEAAAHVGAAQRKDREKVLVRKARVARRKRAHPAAEAAVAKRQRAHRLRLILLPAALILLMMMLGKLGKDVPVETRPIALRVGGEVQAAGRAMDGDVPVLLTRGQRCETGPDGTARMRTGMVSLTLEPATRVLVESPSRFRLELGGVTLEGTCAISTGFGVLEVQDGRGTFAFVDGRLVAGVEDGTFEWIDPNGVRALASGQGQVLTARPSRTGP